MNIAVVPIRSGSKGLKNKNIKTFCGEPLFYWTLFKLQKLIEEGILDKVIVSSDSWTYLNKVLDYFSFEGLVIADRPDKLAKGNTHTEEIIVFHLKQLKIDEGVITLVEVTSPLIPITELRKVCQVININTCSSFLVSPDYSQFWSKGDKDVWHSFYQFREMRQNNKTPFYREIGVWSTKIEDFLKYRNRIVYPVKPIEIPSKYGISINDKYDFMLAEKVFGVDKEEILDG